jgi:O-antigen/teichoic acid export membrane protein
VIRIIATPEYLNPVNSIYSSLDAFRIVLAVLMFYFVSLSFIYMLIASEKQGILLWINSGVTAVNIIGNIILIPYYSFY